MSGSGDAASAPGSRNRGANVAFARVETAAPGRRGGILVMSRFPPSACLGCALLGLSALLAHPVMCGAQAQQDKLREGKLTFNGSCRTCHSVKEGDHRLGPSLHNIVGAKAGSVEGFGNYSQAMRQSGIVWDEETLDAFIAQPDEVVPGNNMKPFAGLPDAEARASIIEYLKSESEG